eukprot:TRINITY_DN1838_c0_g2_i1.p1 TRINITY_DN1838_c0_g2~~TRINITY_DN1838_c0_g2_i1.p1  ORF type:complete len:334 (-),score=6.12 TRINITY_DN1838_c0_g2_i1:244-1245(-)
MCSPAWTNAPAESLQCSTCAIHAMKRAKPVLTALNTALRVLMAPIFTTPPAWTLACRERAREHRGPTRAVSRAGKAATAVWLHDEDEYPSICTEYSQSYQRVRHLDWYYRDGVACVYAEAMEDRTLYRLYVAAVLLVAARILPGKCKASLKLSNCTVIISYIATISYIFQLVYSVTQKETDIIIATAVSTGLHYLANIHFFINYLTTFKKRQVHTVVQRQLTSLLYHSHIFHALHLTFQTGRILYSKFSGVFDRYAVLLESLRHLSVVQMGVGLWMVIINCFELLYLPCGSVSYITLFVTLVASIALVGFLLYEILNTVNFIKTMERRIRTRS